MLQNNQYTMEIPEKPEVKEANESFYNMVQRNKAVGMKWQYKFRQTFGMSIGEYHNIVYGFDICRFDEQVIHSPDGESCAEAIERLYGKEALAMVSELVGIKETGGKDGEKNNP